MKFSIIIPAYNADKTLNRCIDSILAQTFQDFEVIVINDGSKDKTKQIVDQYANSDSRISAIHKPNGGVSSARNEGLRTAIGEYIVFIDADDYIDKDYLESFSKSDADIIICGFKMFGSVSVKNTPFPQFISIQDKINNFICGNISECYCKTPWSKAFKRCLINKAAAIFDIRMKFGEDTDFNFRTFASAKNIEVIATSGYNYYYDDPFKKWILKPKEYAYSIHKILWSINLTACRETNKAKNNMRDCFFYFFILSLWNAPFFKSLQMAIAYFWYRLFNYTPYSGYLKLRKVSSIIAIPFIKLFKDKQ